MSEAGVPDIPAQRAQNFVTGGGAGSCGAHENILSLKQFAEAAARATGHGRRDAENGVERPHGCPPRGQDRSWTILFHTFDFCVLYAVQNRFGWFEQGSRTELGTKWGKSEQNSERNRGWT
jgi:hypothetical protein